MCDNSMCHGKCQLCQDKRSVATNLIDRCYKGLVNTLADLARIHIRTTKPSQLKHWWDDEASSLKNNARNTYKIWSRGSKPPNGVLFDNMLSANKSIKNT